MVCSYAAKVLFNREKRNVKREKALPGNRKGIPDLVIPH